MVAFKQLETFSKIQFSVKYPRYHEQPQEGQEDQGCPPSPERLFMVNLYQIHSKHHDQPQKISQPIRRKEKVT